MLEINNLSASYENLPVLKNINLQVAEGEICTIVGPSGSGKSTLLKAVAGLINEYSGEILFGGKPVNTQNQTIGYIPQNYGLLPWKTVEQNIILALKIKNLPLIRNGISVADETLRHVGLFEHKNKFPNALSGGQKQRIAIARAFVLQSDILLMDEPFSALDSITKEQMQQFFLDIWESQKATTLFITHDIEEAVFLGKKVVIMLPEQPLYILESPDNDRESESFVRLCMQVRRFMREGRDGK